MNETTFKFTTEEKEQTLQILERLRTAVGNGTKFELADYTANNALVMKSA